MGWRAVAVVGGGRCSPEEYETARAVGRGLALRGAAVVCGGAGGVMEAACRGAAEAHGLSIGLLPGDTADGANPYLSVPVPTGLGEGRNLLVVRAAEAVIAVGGEYGTLSEIGLALKLGKRVVGLGTWELRRSGRLDEGIMVAHSAEEAVSLALAGG